MSSIFNIIKQKHAPSRKNFLKLNKFETILEQYLEGTGDSLGIAQKVFEIFSAILTAQRIHFGKCPNKSGDQWAHFPWGLQPTGNKENPLAYITESPQMSDIFCISP